MFKPNINRLAEKGNIKGLLKVLEQKNETLKIEALNELSFIVGARLESIYVFHSIDEKAGLKKINLINNEYYKNVFVENLKSSNKELREKIIMLQESMKKLGDPEILSHAILDEEYEISKMAIISLIKFFQRSNIKSKFYPNK